MTNIIEDIYTTAWIAGKLGYPVNLILIMPSRHGKSLTTYRFYSIRDEIVIIPSDTTAQSYRRIIADVHSKGNLDKVELVILEDWTKVRDRVKEPMAAELVKFSTGIYSLDQMDLQISPTRVSCSVIINVTPNIYRNLREHIGHVGGGDRFITFELELTGENKKILDKLGYINRRNPVKTINLPIIEDRNDYNEFADKFFESPNNPTNEVNFAYAATYLRDNLYDELKVLLRDKRIKNISWKEYW